MKDEDTHKDLFLCLEVLLADATKAVVDLEGLNGFHGAPLLKGCLREYLVCANVTTYTTAHTNHSQIP